MHVATTTLKGDGGEKDTWRTLEYLSHHSETDLSKLESEHHHQQIFFTSQKDDLIIFGGFAQAVNNEQGQHSS